MDHRVCWTIHDCTILESAIIESWHTTGLRLQISDKQQGPLSCAKLCPGSLHAFWWLHFNSTIMIMHSCCHELWWSESTRQTYFQFIKGIVKETSYLVCAMLYHVNCTSVYCQKVFDRSQYSCKPLKYAADDMIHSAFTKTMCESTFSPCSGGEIGMHAHTITFFQHDSCIETDPMNGERTTQCSDITSIYILLNSELAWHTDTVLCSETN